MKYSGIPYEALDSTGRPLMREARVIGELPHEARFVACADAAKWIGQSLGLNPVSSIPFGAPIYEAFGLNRPEAKAHPQAKFLLQLGHEVALVHCG